MSDPGTVRACPRCGTSDIDWRSRSRRTTTCDECIFNETASMPMGQPAQWHNVSLCNVFGTMASKLTEMVAEVDNGV